MPEVVTRQDALCGVLAVDKPRGMISKDVSRWLQKFVGKKVRLGHVGTLDPEAEGVLPLLLGKATRLQDHLLCLPKTYECDIQLGYLTTTLDLDGEVTERKPWEHVTLSSLEEAAGGLVGVRRQRPPLYSAVKHKGRALYDYARKGEEGLIEWDQISRDVEVHAFEVTGFQADTVSIRVRCGRGTYIRVLAAELAEKVGTLGTVTRLVRTESSGVFQESSFSLDEIERFLKARGSLGEPVLIPLERVAMGLPSGRLSEEQCARLLNGQPVIFPDSGIAPPEGLYNNDVFSLEKGTDIFLMDISGRAFGLGSGVRHDAGNILVRMKRSLL